MKEKDTNVAERIKSLRKIIRNHISDLDAFDRQIPEKFRSDIPEDKYGEIAIVGHNRFFS